MIVGYRTYVYLKSLINSVWQEKFWRILKSSMVSFEEEPAPLFRLAFVRKDSYMLEGDLSGPDVHFIDNIELEFKHSSKGIKVETSFLLTSDDHGFFDETYDAIVVNAFNGMPLLLLDPFESMRVEEFYVPYPIGQSKPQLPLDPKNKMYMKVESCIESEEQYTLRIAIECDGNVSGEFCISPSFFFEFCISIGSLCCKFPLLSFPFFTGLMITTNEQVPCESCHDVTVSLTQPSKIKPLSLTFPFPILAKNVQATLHRTSRHVDLLLKKSLLEPWPCEFHSKNSKWITDDLMPWENVPFTPENGLNTSEHHLTSQLISKNINSDHFLDSKSSALDNLRLKLGVLMLHDAEFVSYGRNDDRYLLKLHRPLLTYPIWKTQFC
jgi:hypothetical protein